MNSSQFAGEVIRRLEKRYGMKLHTELAHRNLTELFVAVFLSPQCTDRQVNKTTPALFRKFRSFDRYADADIGILMGRLNGLNYYKTKARNLKEASRMIVDRYGGKVPRTLRELMELPGVGRKVANVVLNEGFGINEGIAVDTHCMTVARRLRLSRHKTAEKIELDLLRKIPKDKWHSASNLLIALGKDTCRARAKECGRCVLRSICPSSLR